MVTLWIHWYSTLPVAGGKGNKSLYGRHWWKAGACHYMIYNSFLAVRTWRECNTESNQGSTSWRRWVGDWVYFLGRWLSCEEEQGSRLTVYRQPAIERDFIHLSRVGLLWQDKAESAVTAVFLEAYRSCSMEYQENELAYIISTFIELQLHMKANRMTCMTDILTYKEEEQRNF